MLIFPVIKGTACILGRNRVISTINPKGKIDIISFKDKKNSWKTNIPFLRGITLFLYGIYIFLISLNRSQVTLKNEKEPDLEEKIAKKLKVSRHAVALSISGIIGAIIGILGIVLIPFFVFSTLVDAGVGQWFAAFTIALIRIVLFLLILFSLKMIPSMRQFYRNNSAGNLAIANYKDRKIDTYHLSTNFLNFIICGLFLSLFVVSFMIIDLNFFLRILINMALILVCFSVTYEFLKVLEFRNGEFSKMLIISLSYFTNEKPTQTERDIAFSAVSEVILMQNNEERLIGETKDTEIVFSVVYTEVKSRLNEVGINDKAEVDWLIAESLGKNRNDIKFITHIGREDYRKIKSALAKREKRMPLTKIFNHANFYGYDFYVDKNVLSPRPETELVVEEAIKIIKEFKNDKTKVLDLMTGSGVMAVTIAKQTKSNVFASDVSEQALTIARKNAKNNKVKIKFIESDIFKKFKRQKFDIIVSNPPYIPSKDILTLDDEVKKFDPLISLDGGDDGFYFYKKIAQLSPKFLKANGYLILEIGEDQGKEVRKLLQKDFENIRIKKDYNKNDRIVIAKLKG
ncbi:MAG: peptide chain release factor N(5)-glutamine methyltransferase [Clostridia bacterium]|nr:peptide chain release factor N(5)-glutamine methyltransferase [Clostridia bacterium]